MRADGRGVRPQCGSASGVWGTLLTDGWRLKSTAITHADRTFSPRFAEAAAAAARAALPHPAVTPTRYGLGFLGVHRGRTADVAFVDWWEDEDELHHIMFVTGAGGDLRPARPGELTACSWDLALIAFERDAWLRRSSSTRCAGW